MSIMLSLPQNSRFALAIVDMQEFFFQKPERRQMQIWRRYQSIHSTQQSAQRMVGILPPQASVWLRVFSDLKAIHARPRC